MLTQAVRQYASVFQSNGIVALAFPSVLCPPPLINCNGDTPGQKIRVNGKWVDEASYIWGMLFWSARNGRSLVERAGRPDIRPSGWPACCRGWQAAIVACWDWESPWKRCSVRFLLPGSHRRRPTNTGTPRVSECGPAGVQEPVAWRTSTRRRVRRASPPPWRSGPHRCANS